MIHVFPLVRWFRDKHGNWDFSKAWLRTSTETMDYTVTDQKPEPQIDEANWTFHDQEIDEFRGQYETLFPWKEDPELLEHLKRRLSWRER